MASFNNQYPLPSGMAMGVRQQVELIWQMGLASLSSNDNHVVIPIPTAQLIRNEGVEALKFRLAQYLGAQIVAYPDVATRTLHICPLSGYNGAIPIATAVNGSGLSVTTPIGTPSSVNSASEIAEGKDKKSKIPRPPNAFILYRKHFHPILKDKHPNLHNNEISVILGKQWQAEAEDVKNDFRARAEKIKKKHALDNPGYQYAPRKPSEKKRRMTARKLAQLQASEEQSSPLSIGSPFSQSASTTPASNAALFGDGENFLNTTMDGQMLLSMPTPIFSLDQQLFQRQMESSDMLVPFNEELQTNQLSTTTATQNTNQTAFMDSVIDWNGINEDAQLVFGAPVEDGEVITNAETGEFLTTYTESLDLDFEAELAKLAKLL